MAGTYRYWLICLPSVDPDSLVLFTENDYDGGKIRDYSVPGTVREVQRVQLDDVKGVFRAATRRLSVEPHKTTDHRHWWNEIQRFSVERHKTPEPSHSRNEIQKRSLIRCDDTGRAFAGSQRQIQFYVNERPSVLNQAISDAFKTTFSLRWVSPLSSDRYREYWDSAFLKALGLPQHCKELSRFWPNGGPHWDALASVGNRRGGVVLVEAKSHVAEIFGNGCGAEAASSVKKIEQAIAATKEWLRVSPQADWTGPLYQSANRIAHLYFLREILRIEAWLVNVYFTDDPHSPTSKASWQGGIADVKNSLGIGVVPHCADVFLPAV